MATKLQSDTRISSAALGLLDHYTADLNELVLSLAERISRKRLGNSEPLPTRISVDDVREAAEVMTNAFSAKFSGSQDEQFLELLESMNRCLKSKQQMMEAKPTPQVNRLK